MVKFTEVLTYPFRNVKDFLIGGVINIFFWAIIPLFFIFGYLVRIMQNTINNVDMIPDWKEWKDLAKKGIDSIFIIIVYIIVPLIVLIAAPRFRSAYPKLLEFSGIPFKQDD